MALPSSPPLLPDIGDDEVDLPSSPPLPSSSAHHLPALPTRKRPLPDDDNIPSSDPLFSEDPSEAEDQTEYDRPKRKRMVKGPWWTLKGRGSQPPDSRARDDFRNADSGVWLGSDESIDSLLNNARDLNVEDRIFSSAQPSSVSTPDRIAQQTIDSCVEAGYETVDLSGIGLAHLSSDTLKPLHQLIRQSHSTLMEPPSEDEFVSLTPSIKLYLYGNRLASLPAELFRLENVTVLSLRNNELGAIPHAVARLRKLKELNIAGNNIHNLPWELMRFVDCQGDEKQIITRPNPLVEPTKIEGPSPLASVTVHTNLEDFSRWGDTGAYYDGLRQAYLDHGPLDMRAELELRLKLGRLRQTQYFQEASRAGKELSVRQEELIYLVSSAVRYFGVDGTPLRRSRPEDDNHHAVINSLRDAPELDDCSFSPSLFELALKAIQKEYSLQELPTDSPHTIASGLQTAALGVEFGNQTCSTCDRLFIIPRAQWIEYWHNGSPSDAELKREKILPFMRKACSWRCATPTQIGEFRC